MSRKKVLMTASTLPRYEGDTEPRFVLDLAVEMNKKYDVTVLAPMDPSAKMHEVLDGVKIERYHYFPIHKWETLCYPGAIAPRVKEKKIRLFLVPCLFMGLHRYLRKHVREYDMVHAHWLIPQGMVQAGFNTPYLVTGHGGDVTSLNMSPIKRRKKKSIRKAKHVTVVSEYLKEYVKSWGEPADIDVLPMGCDLTLFSPENKKDNLFEQGDKKVILFVGRLAEKKGVTYLIEAMKQIDDAILVIVGKGPLAECLREQAGEQGDKIRFLGPKTHDELAELYASADVFAMPSVTASDGDQEGFGLVILEAMASGIPVVGYNSGGIGQIITSGDNGLLSEERDVDGLATNLQKVLRDESIRREIVAKGFETAEIYSYANIGEKYSKIYDKVMNDGQD